MIAQLYSIAHMRVQRLWLRLRTIRSPYVGYRARSRRPS